MSNVNAPSPRSDRRLRLSRLRGVVFAVLAILGAAYFLLQEKSVPVVDTAEAPKDIAALFESVQGNVKTRGVGGLEWRTAEVKTPLRKSDLVRTYPSSSAEIRFFDETRVTVRPDSLITIEETSRDPKSTSGKIAWRVSSGEINYETTQKGAGSTEAVTPTFRLALEGNSTGTMRVDEGGQTAVAQISGVANIQTKSGEKIRLGANEGLRVDAAGKAGAKQVLPEPPTGTVPVGGTLSLSEGAPVVLTWSASSGASLYRLQVEAKGGSGSEVVFDRNGMTGTTASLPGLGSGEFSFRVAGLTPDGVQGKFSAPVSFRIERLIPPRPAVTTAGPNLVIEAFEARGNVLRLAGKTEPGARLTVNGDPVNVQPDGSFREFVTLAPKQGEQRVVIRATSASGAITEEVRTLGSGQ